MDKMEALQEAAMDIQLEQEFTKIVGLAIDIGNSLAGKQNTNDNKNLIYAEGLGKKIIGHTLSAKLLINGYQLHTTEYKTAPHVDFASIFVLTRAALETYLTLNHIFIAPNSNEEHQFKFLCWDYAGYRERSKFVAKEEEHIIMKEEERIAMEKLKKEIESHTYLKNLTEWQKEAALKGDWKLKCIWLDLAKRACINEVYFTQMYKYLCGHAHTSRLSIWQVQQIKGYSAQKMQARAAIPMLMNVLSKYIYDYVSLIPELRNTINFNTTKYSSILFWKESMEKYDPNQYIPE